MTIGHSFRLTRWTRLDRPRWWRFAFTRFGAGEGRAWRWNGQWQWTCGPWSASYVRGQNDIYA